MYSSMINTVDSTSSILGISMYMYITILLIALSNDVERNPGPITEDECNSLSIIHLNIRSIRNKLSYINEHISDFDILCFTETHLSDEVSDSIVKIDNFNTMYRKDVNNFSGGILVYVNNDLVSKRVTELENALSESIWIELSDGVNTYLLCTLYRRPNTRVEFWDRFETSLERTFEISSRVVIVGDLN